MRSLSMEKLSTEVTFRVAPGKPDASVSWLGLSPANTHAGTVLAVPGTVT
jgi:hypothetical protein